MKAVVGLCLLLLLSAPAAYAEVDQGEAKVVPWSGYWWPDREGELSRGYGRDRMSPLAKHDTVTGAHAEAWHRQFRSGEQILKWHGLCYAWASAALFEPEPRRPITYRGVDFRVGDIKGLLCAAHADDKPVVFGERFRDRDSNRDDIAPDELWRVCREYVAEKGIGLLVDLDAGPEVWTYPVYSYRVEYQPRRRDGGRCEGSIALVMANYVSPGRAADEVGTRSIQRRYRFSVEVRDGEVVPGTGRWEGESRRQHPDFAWHPSERGQENPELDYETIHRLAELSAGSRSYRQEGLRALPEPLPLFSLRPPTWLPEPLPSAGSLLRQLGLRG
jgi:hypothetical protein